MEAVVLQRREALLCRAKDKLHWGSNLPRQEMGSWETHSMTAAELQIAQKMHPTCIVEPTKP